MNLEIVYKATMVVPQKYRTMKNDFYIQAVLGYHNSKAFLSVPKEASKYLNETGTLQDLTIDIKKTSTWKAKQLELKSSKNENRRQCMVSFPSIN